jgi:hypothetical protein
MQIQNACEGGHIIIRDSFTPPKTLISVNGGYKSLGIAAHPHQNLNSFTLAHLGEEFFTDCGESHTTWRFQTEDGNWLDQTIADADNLDNPLSKLLFLESSGSITATASDAAKAYGKVIKKAERMFIGVLPHVLFIVDTIEAEKPVKAQANFVVNNHNNKLDYRIFTPDAKPAAGDFAKGVEFNARLVLRRNKAALKFGQAYSEPACNFSFAGQGKEGSGMVFTRTSLSFSAKHRMVYSIAMMEEEPHIQGWHTFTDEPGIFEIESRGDVYRIRYEEHRDGSFTVTNGETGETLNIERSKFYV